MHFNDKGQELFAYKLATLLKSKLMNEPFPLPQPNPNLPNHWQTMDIGIQDDIGLVGSVSFDSSQVFTLWGSGYGLDFTNDSFRFVYQPLSGPGFLTVTLASHTSFNTCAKAGIIVREHLAPHARHVMLGYSPELGVFASGADRLYKTQKAQFHKVQLHIQKTSENIKLYINNVHWYTVDINLPRDVYLGLAVTSCNSHVVSVAKFSDVALSEGVYHQPCLIIQTSS